jgi:hypothetical protein
MPYMCRFEDPQKGAPFWAQSVDKFTVRGHLQARRFNTGFSRAMPEDAVNSVGQVPKTSFNSGTMTIVPPNPSDDQQERFVRCQDALYSSFLKLLEDANETGWGQQETLVALISLADNHALMLNANAEAEELLATIKRRS